MFNLLLPIFRKTISGGSRNVLKSVMVSRKMDSHKKPNVEKVFFFS